MPLFRGVSLRELRSSSTGIRSWPDTPAMRGANEAERAGLTRVALFHGFTDPPFLNSSGIQRRENAVPFEGLED